MIVRKPHMLERAKSTLTINSYTLSALTEWQGMHYGKGTIRYGSDVSRKSGGNEEKRQRASYQYAFEMNYSRVVKETKNTIRSSTYRDLGQNTRQRRTELVSKAHTKENCS